MKKINWKFVGLFAIIIAVASLYYTSTVYSVSKSNTAVIAADSTAKVYVCPMHPEEISDKPGKCSKCGMDLVLKEDKKDDKSKEMNMNMKDCMDKCKDGGCKMENCGGTSGACKDCTNMKDGKCDMKDGKCNMKMDEKKMDGDCMMGKDKDCKSKCMGK